MPVPSGTGCLTVHCLQFNLGGQRRWQNNLVGAGVPWGLGTACAGDPAGSSRVPGAWATLSLPGWGRAGQMASPHPSCRSCASSLTFVSDMRAAQVLPLTRGSGLGWDGVSAFALIIPVDVGGFPGRSYSVSPSLHWAQASPAHTQHHTQIQTHPYLTTINAAPAVLCPKPWGDQPGPVAALCLPKMSFHPVFLYLITLNSFMENHCDCQLSKYCFNFWSRKERVNSELEMIHWDFQCEAEIPICPCGKKRKCFVVHGFEIAILLTRIIAKSPDNSSEFVWRPFWAVKS